MIRRQPCDEREEEISDWRQSVCKEPAAGKSSASLGKCMTPNAFEA